MQVFEDENNTFTISGTKFGEAFLARSNEVRLNFVSNAKRVASGFVASFQAGSNVSILGILVDQNFLSNLNFTVLN